MPDTIFLIHGMWGGPWYWKNYKGLLESEGYRCIATTLRYHNMDPMESPNPQLGVTSLLDYAKDLEQEIQQLGVTPIIIGHSMEGLLAQILGSRGLAKALVLLSLGSPAGINAITLSVIKSFWSVQTQWRFWRKPMRQTFAEAVYSILHLLPADEQKETFKRFVYESGRAAFESVYWFLDSKKASKVEETKVVCPVLVIGGSQDRIVPASVARQVAKKYKSVTTYKEFKDHAHWLIAEPGWQEVANFVESWLGQVVGKND